MTAHAPKTSTAPLAPLMKMGCTNVTITYRAGGNETVCLQSAPHGVQQLANFNPAAGDVIGVDDILELTLAHDNLSDVGQYITSQLTNGGTMLYFDPTGQGLQGTPFAFLQGVATTVARLVANGGMQYIPDAISVAPAFDSAISLRSGGLETVMLHPLLTGIGPQVINGFNATNADKLELANILNPTLALPDLSNLANYITATQSNGNTILSVDPTGTGQPGTQFAVLDGVTITVAQLLADGALLYDPTKVNLAAVANSPFTYRASGQETAGLAIVHGRVATNQLTGFSLAAGDAIDVGCIMRAASVTPNLAAVQADFTTVQQGANTQLWFNPNGSGTGGTLEAVLLNTTVTLNQMLAQSAISWAGGQGTSNNNGVIMRMGCTNQLITYSALGNETVCLQSPQHGVQQLANFNPAAGDVIGVDDILETTLAHANLSDVANYITSQQINGGTMLFIDLTGQAQQGTPFAFLQGVTTTVAQLVADGGMQYVPDQVAIAPTYNEAFTLRPDGLETVLLNPIAPGIGPQQISGFALGAGDNLELANILNKTLAAPTLSNVGNFIAVTDVGGNTILSVDPTGQGGAGTAFAVLENTTLTLSQLLAGSALTFDPTPTQTPVAPGTTFLYRTEGAETAGLQSAGPHACAALLNGFSLANGDGIDVVNILSAADIQTDLSNIGNYISTVETGGNTQIWFDPNGSGHGGTLEAVLQNTSVTMNDLLSHSALHLT
jgi:hypothetical protein